MAFGDTDHDNLNEVILWVRDAGSNYNFRIVEEQGNNLYKTEYTGPSLIPFATGDLDRDGKSEIVGQVGSQLQIYEGIDAQSYPSNLVWSTAIPSNVLGYDAIGDTDGDGRMEIIHSSNSFGGNSELIIFENAGDNTFNAVYSTPVGGGAMGDKVIADLDLDGSPEIAFSGVYGHVYVYRSDCNNSWRCMWSDSTELVNAYSAVGGQDTDANGKPELAIQGDGPGGETTIIYEYAGNNHFQRVATLTHPGSTSGTDFLR